MKNIFLLTMAFLLNGLWLKAQTPCPNLVTNGDFEAPNASFTFGLPLNAGCAINSYNITTNFNLKCAAFPSFSARTNPGTGKFLVVQSSTATNIWSTNVTVTPNTPYTFSFWVSGTTPYPTSLAMVVGGSNVPLSITVPSVSNWVQYTYSGTTPAGVMSLAIAIKQLSAGEAYSYGIDDISFQSCSAAPCDAAFTSAAVGSCGNYQFTNTSTGTGLTYFWIFGDPNSGGNNSTAGQNPTHQFTTCGSYPVRLIISGTDCRDTAFQTINYTETTPPVITCPANKSLTCISDTTPSVTGFATATDNCPNVVISYADTLQAGNLLCEGVFRRTWKATDACGNRATCVQTINVFDNTAPVITCPANKTVNCLADTIPSITGTPTVTDNCPNSVTLTRVDVVTGVLCDGGSIRRTWTARDGCGRTVSCSQTIIISPLSPTITCPANVTLVCNTSTAPSVTGTATATDNCGTATTLTFTDATTGSLPCEARITRTWTAVGACNRASTCQQSIFVRDNVAPTITCPPNTTVSCSTVASPTLTGTATATDNCSATPTITSSDQALGIFLPCNGFINRTWTAQDACGNTSTCLQVITVIDRIPPTIVCPPNITVVCAKDTLPSITGLATATDNCTGASLSRTDTIAGTLPCDAVIRRTWRARDVCGNVSSCVQTIFVRDNVAPILTNCPTNQTVNTNLGQCYYTFPTLPAITATDNCDPTPSVSYSYINSLGITLPFTTATQFPKGLTSIKITAKDACGNVSQACTFILTVVDNEPPKIVCPLSVTAVGTLFDGICKANLTGIAPTVTDNCPMVNTIYNITSVSFGTTGSGASDASGTQFMGTSQVTYTATDMAGLTASCNFNVRVICNTQGIIVTKYNDLNCNGKRDSLNGLPTDPGVTGFNFTITNTATTQSFTSTTTGAGQVFFSSLSPGTYTVTEVPQSGWIPTNPASGTMTVVVNATGVTNVSFGNCKVCVPTATADSICNAPIDVLFVLDNSGSMDALAFGSPTPRFTLAKNMITASIAQIQSAYSNAKFGVVHYGGPCGERLFIEHNFKSANQITSINRQYPPNGPNDDLNKAFGNVLSALNLSPLSTVYPTNAVLNQRTGSNLLIVTFTDGLPFTSAFCSGSALLPYTNSNTLKSVKNAKITMVHLDPSGTYPICAAIASSGGTYSGAISNNGYDSNIPGNRQFIPFVFSSTTPFNILPALPVCDSLRISCCDSLVVMPTTTTTAGNTCCTSLNLKNKVGTKVVKFEVELINSPCWQFQTGTLLTAAGFNWTTTGQKITLAHNSGQFPIGTTNAALQYCLASNCPTAIAAQTVVFRWYMQDPRDTSKRIICTDTLRTSCLKTPVTPNCLALVDSTVRCNPDNPYEYFFNFRVQNFTGAAMNQVIMHGLPAGYGFSICGGTFPTTSLALNLSPFPLPNNAISNTICIKIIAPFPILSPTNVCFKLGFQNDSICCHATDSVCVLLKPCCDPCEGIDATAQAIPNSVDGCCYKLDLKRSCQYRLFSRIETEVLTPGVIFGYHALGGPDAANWFVFPGATPTKISYGPMSGAINQNLVDDIIQFCLDNITSTSQIPQKVVVRWYTSLPPGERVLCTDTLVFNCNREVTCVKVVPTIVCIPDSNKYRLTMTIMNLSSIPFNATHFMVNIVSPLNLFMSPSGGFFPLIPTLVSGGTATITTDVVLTSGTFPTSMILNYRLGFFNGSSFDTCCFDNIRDTIILPPCGSDPCRCGAFASNFYRPTQGGASVPKVCGDTLSVVCNTQFSPILSGVYNCVGTCPSSGMKWEIRKVPNGPVLQTGLMPTTYSLSLSPAFFSTSGNYELTLIPRCGSDTCTPCKFTLVVQLCDTCQCRGFEGMSFFNNTWAQPLSKPAKCDSSYTLPCTFGNTALFHGNFRCSSQSCIPDSVSYSITQGINVIQSGKVKLNYWALALGHFDINFNPALFTTGVQYTITVTGMCGSQVCTCKVNFTFAPCPCPCPTFAQDVAKGFKTLGITAIGCKKTVMPIGLCPNDVVTWIVNGSSVGTSTGNASFTITFASSGIFTVCMAVTRFNPDGSVCNKTTKCQPITVNCPQPIIDVTHCTKNSVTGNGLKNGNFTEGVVDGHLWYGGVAQNWTLFPNTGDGFVMVDAATGASDGGHLIFNADNSNRAGVFQQITLPISTFTVVEYYARNYSGTSLPAGTVVEFRLYNEPIVGSPSQLIYSDTIPKDSLAWMRRTFSPRISPDQTKRFFNICLSNNSTTDKSTIGVDNIEICSSTTVDTKEATVSGQFRIVPNPNQGTFTVVLSERATLGMKLRILNSIGEVVQDFTTKLNNEEQTIEATHLPNGLYFLQVVLDGKIMGVEKFVKQ